MRPVEVEAAVDEVLRQAVLVLIDHALDKNDKALFLLLTWELRKLNEKWPDREGLEALRK
ncbi:MAG: IDEAL domain-containing protein [Carboxydocellales bacterium]